MALTRQTWVVNGRMSTKLSTSTLMALTHWSKLADGREALVRAILDHQAAPVGALNRDMHSHVLLLQLPHALPEN